jgi:hypothetical protein
MRCVVVRPLLILASVVFALGCNPGTPLDTNASQPAGSPDVSHYWASETSLAFLPPTPAHPLGVTVIAYNDQTVWSDRLARR